jgi:hypothetical protein
MDDTLYALTTENSIVGNFIYEKRELFINGKD